MIFETKELFRAATFVARCVGADGIKAEWPANSIRFDFEDESMRLSCTNSNIQGSIALSSRCSSGEPPLYCNARDFLRALKFCPMDQVVLGFEEKHLSVKTEGYRWKLNVHPGIEDWPDVEGESKSAMPADQMSASMPLSTFQAWCAAAQSFPGFEDSEKFAFSGVCLKDGPALEATDGHAVFQAYTYPAEGPAHVVSAALLAAISRLDDPEATVYFEHGTICCVRIPHANAWIKTRYLEKPWPSLENTFGEGSYTLTSHKDIEQAAAAAASLGCETTCLLKFGSDRLSIDTQSVLDIRFHRNLELDDRDVRPDGAVRIRPSYLIHGLKACRLPGLLCGEGKLYIKDFEPDVSDTRRVAIMEVT